MDFMSKFFLFSGVFLVGFVVSYLFPTAIEYSVGFGFGMLYITIDKFVKERGKVG